MKKAFPSIVCAAVAMATGFIGSAEAAEVDPSIHKLCIEAKDYAGCVRVMKGDTTTTTI